MSDGERRAGSPWTIETLADLQAGVLDAREEAELRAKAQADPQAREMLAALDATMRDLRQLPPIPMPADVAARIDAAIAREVQQRASGLQPQSSGAHSAPAQTDPQSGLAQVIDFNAARKRRNTRLSWGVGLLAAAAAAVGIAVLAPPTAVKNPMAQPVPTSVVTEPSVNSGNYSTAMDQVIGAENYGSLGNAQRLAECLRGGGISFENPVGVSPITLNDKPAVMVILPSGQLNNPLRIVVVDPATCGADNPDGVLANTLAR